MSASRAFSLLLWLGLGGLLLLVAAGIRPALQACPFGGNLHDTTDGICMIVPVHGDYLAHALGYGAAFLLLGVLVLAVRYVAQQAVALRSMAKDIAGAASVEHDGRLQNLITQTGITTDVVLLESRGRTAFTAGLWRPRIFVTTELIYVLTDKQLEAVPLHEEYHARRKDPLRTVLARALATMLFFLPVLRDLASYHHVRKEVEADASTIRRQWTRVHIASALFRLTGSNYSDPAGAVAFNEEGSVEARIEALQTGRWRGTPFSASTVISSVVGILLLITLVAQPLTEVHNWSTTAFSLAACPVWLVLYWITRLHHSQSG